MAGILDRLLSGGSTLGYNGIQPIANTVAGENGVQSLLSESTLDLDGLTPITYQQTAPEGQGGRVGSSAA